MALGPHFAYLTAVPLEALAFVVLGFIPNTKSSDSASSDIESTEGEESPPANGEGEESMNDENSSKNKVLQALSHLSHNIRLGSLDGVVTLDTSRGSDSALCYSPTTSQCLAHQ
ncbi:hypothetical protein LB505_013957 [Fusarium chuoi]|nr:hypothetical protein LB505_013957 [Fusarium chuoi]